MKAVFNGALLVAMMFIAEIGVADQFHYNNVLMGDRASGMGGAFCAVADDASGVVYNPAGIAFALSNDISGSANAFYTKKVTYKDATFGEDFTEDSSGSLAPFVGALGKLDHIWPGLVFAFGIFSTDSELKDQDDLIYNEARTSRFHRTANLRANTSKFGLAFGRRFGGSIAAGFGLTLTQIDELSQTYQDSFSYKQGYTVDADTNKRTEDSDGNQTKGDVYKRFLNQNLREHLQAYAIEPSLGIQVAFLKNMSMGLTVKVPIIMWEQYTRGFEKTIHYTDTGGAAVDLDDTGIKDLDGLNEATGKEYTSAKQYEASRAVIENQKVDKPLGSLPTEIRWGYAWFASTNLLMTMDLIYHTAAKNGDLAKYEREAVLNEALGIEYYLSPSWPLRFGLFTNNDARPKLDHSKTSQRDHIDYIGSSIFIAMVQPNSQIALGVIYQNGSGEAQKVSGSTTVQKVEAASYTLGFTVSHNF